ncbi:MAG: patatin-like phospholipase family protein [Caldilineaceae bacterium]|nr:patatin-like phospholipase family protein [Caldilineaceae bacterium]
MAGSTMAQSNLDGKIGVALCGGAVLGAAHVGILRAFEEREIHIHCMAGTSIGALVAALYAFGTAVGEIEAIVSALSWLDVTSFVPSKLGLLSNQKLGDVVSEVLGDVRIEDSPMPIAFIAADLRSGEKVLLRRGDVATAVMASACIPGLFTPVEFGDRLLVDGGIVEIVPISPLREMGADYLVGVDLRGEGALAEPQNIVDVLVDTTNIAIATSKRLQLQEADLVIAPRLASYSSLDTDKVAELIRIGYEAALIAMREVDAL